MISEGRTKLPVLNVVKCQGSDCQKFPLVFANFAFYDRELRYVVIGGDESIEMKLCLL